MKIVLIGGTGNLSSECAELLQARGHDVALLTRGRSAVPAMFRSLVADRTDANALHQACLGFWPEIVINFLGFTPADLEVDIEVFGRKIRQYLFISSAAAYAKPPITLPITESESLGNPFWDYAQKKQACEELLNRHGQLPSTIVRPSHTYGTSWFPNLLASASYTLPSRLLAGKPLFLPDVDNLWTLTAASDFAVGLAGLVGNEGAVGEAFHITSDEAMTWPDIYAHTAAALGAPPPKMIRMPLTWLCEQFPELTGPLRGDKANPAVFNNTKIKRFVPDFVCRTPFSQGIGESAAHIGVVNPEVDALYDRVIATWQRRCE